MLHKAELQWQLLLYRAGDCMNDNATDTGPFIAWRHANGATICSTLVLWMMDKNCTVVVLSPHVPSCHSSPAHNAPCDTLRIFLVMSSAEILISQHRVTIQPDTGHSLYSVMWSVKCWYQTRQFSRYLPLHHAAWADNAGGHTWYRPT